MLRILQEKKQNAEPNQNQNSKNEQHTDVTFTMNTTWLDSSLCIRYKVSTMGLLGCTRNEGPDNPLAVDLVG